MLKQMRGTFREVGTAVVGTIVTVLTFLNVFSGIIGGIWLAIMGQWSLIGIGIGMTILMPWVFMIVDLPSTGLAALAAYFSDRGSRLFTGVFGFLGATYTFILVALWVIFVFGVFINDAVKGSFLPYLLWAYGIIMAPLAYMASKEPPDSIGSSAGLFFAQLSFLVVAGFWAFYRINVTALLIIAVLLLAMTSFLSYIAASGSEAEAVYDTDE